MLLAVVPSALIPFCEIRKVPCIIMFIFYGQTLVIMVPSVTLRGGGGGGLELNDIVTLDVTKTCFAPNMQWPWLAVGSVLKV